jgi:hypothetical protein
VASNVTIDVTGAKDANGNAQTDYTAQAEFSIDMGAPADPAPYVTAIQGVTELKNGNTATITFTFSEAVYNFSSADVSLSDSSNGSTIGSFSPVANTGNTQWTATFTKGASNSTTISVLDSGNVNSTTQSYWTDSASQPGANTSHVSLTISKKAPAGIAGEPINLALDGPAGVTTTVQITSLPVGWVIEGAVQQPDGTWLLESSNVSALTVTTPPDYTGAEVLNITLSWIDEDGTMTTVLLTDNVEAFPPSNPVFAWNGDDNLTGSSGADTFVFSNPIGFDTIYSFDAGQDQVDLIGYAGFNSFQDVVDHLSSNDDGDALITLTDGQTITLDGVAGTSLSASNFVFNQTPGVTNTGSMAIGNGAMLPLSGDMTNSGTISLNAAGSETLLQVIQRGMTLSGGGQVILSDDAGNVISGTLSTVTLVNVDNTISGAGQIGAGLLTLENHGTIIADGVNSLVIDTGPNEIVNMGMLAGSGSGGLLVSSSLYNGGLLWANCGVLTFTSTVSGDGEALISGSGSIEFGAASSADVLFESSAAGHLTLDAPSLYTGMISGFDDNDVIDLNGIDFGSVSSLTYAQDADHTGGVLTLWTANGSVDLHLRGDFDQSDFALEADQDGSTLIGVHHHDALIGNADLLM